MMIICLIPEILSTIDIILCHFGPFFASSPPNNFENQNLEKNKRHAWRYHHFTLVYHKWWSYDIWFLRYWVQQTDFLTFWTIFCPFTNLTTQKIKILEKKKKTACGDIIILHMCTINDTYMMYGFWDMECKRQNVLSFWVIFCPFIPLTTQKIKILKKWKNKCMDISSFYTCLPHVNIIWCMVPEILNAMDRIFCHIGPFFPLFPP